MANIKTKKKNLTKIRKLEKAKVYTQKLRNNIVGVKEKSVYTNKAEEKESTPTEYGINKISDKMNLVTHKGIDGFNKYGQKSVKETKNNMQQLTQKIKKKVQDGSIKKNIKMIKGATSENVKTASKNTETNIKTTNLKYKKRAIKNVPKIAQKSVQEKTKGFKKAYQVAKITAEKTVKGIKTGIEEAVSAIKSIITATRALIACLIAGSWIAIIIIILMCLIGLICSSAMGIFFSNEKGVGGISMNLAITNINQEFASKITEIQNTNEHDDFEINSNRATWKDIIAVYSVLVTKGKDQSDVITLDEKKVEKLKSVFWEMNMISARTEDVEKDIETTDENGNVKIEKMTRKILYIDVTSRSVEEMIQIYNFNRKQLEQLTELRKEEYNSLWSKVLYGSSVGSTDIVQVAFSQLGNIGGEPFWSWYGYPSRVEWCACFVSWCANQCGYIDSGIIPKFSACQSEGVSWFKTCGLWQERGYIPKSGDIIFFDWEVDGHSDHVGIVERCENGFVYTIEGNSTGDMCKQNAYEVNSEVILGYGIPMY